MRKIETSHLYRRVYGVRLSRIILEEHDGGIDRNYHWTDSSPVLQGQQSSHRKQQVFVANKAAEFLKTSSIDQWRHVKGIGNSNLLVHKLALN